MRSRLRLPPLGPLSRRHLRVSFFIDNNSPTKYNHSMDNLKIGSIIETPQHRDAIHVAVAPVIALEKLYPGDHIGLKGDKASADAKWIGIVDPFLKNNVQPGDQFWMFLHPGSITSLRHDWTHPAFEMDSDTLVSERDVSEKWIRTWAATLPAFYEQVLKHAHDYLKYGDYWSEGGRFEGYFVPDEFWKHYQNVTGKEVKENDRGSFFSCAC